MLAHAETMLPSDVIGWLVCAWTFLSIIRFIACDPSCDPRMRTRWDLRNLTDHVPWTVTRLWTRVLHAAPPPWVPLGLSYLAFIIVAVLLSILLGA